MRYKNISGGDRLARKLKALPKVYQETVDKTLEKSGAEMARSARALVPTRTGALKESIGHRVEASEDGGRAVAVFAGDAAAFYARWVEFGTKAGGMARPFFWPAYRLMRRLLKRRIRAASKRAVKKIAGMR